MHISLSLYLSVANPIPTQQKKNKKTGEPRVQFCRNDLPGEPGKSCEFSVLNVRNYFVLCRLNRSFFSITFPTVNSDQNPKNCSGISDRNFCVSRISEMNASVGNWRIPKRFRCVECFPARSSTFYILVWFRAVHK